MKGKIEIRFDAPNVARFRSRVKNPSKELSGQIRGLFAKAICEVVNENRYAINSKIVKELKEMGVSYASAKYEDQVNSVFSPFFNILTAPTVDELIDLVGEEKPEPKKLKGVGSKNPAKAPVSKKDDEELDDEDFEDEEDDEELDDEELDDEDFEDEEDEEDFD